MNYVYGNLAEVNIYKVSSL